MGRYLSSGCVDSTEFAVMTGSVEVVIDFVGCSWCAMRSSKVMGWVVVSVNRSCRASSPSAWNSVLPLLMSRAKSQSVFARVPGTGSPLSRGHMNRGQSFVHVLRN